MGEIRGKSVNAFVLPADQPDWSAAMRFARSLWHCGVQLQRATKAFEVAGDDRRFHAVTGATVRGASVVLRCPEVARPVAVPKKVQPMKMKISRP